MLFARKKVLSGPTTSLRTLVLIYLGLRTVPGYSTVVLQYVPLYPGTRVLYISYCTVRVEEAQVGHPPLWSRGMNRRMNDSKQRRGRVTIGCSRRQARLGLFGACITALVLASRSLFLGGLGHSGGGRDVLAAVQRAAGGMGGMGGMLMGTSRRKSSPSRLPLFDALVVYDAAAGPGEEKGAPGEKKKGANDQAKAVALTSAAAVDARGGIVPILVVAGCRPRMLRRALLSLLACDGVAPGLVLVSVDAQRACGGAAARLAQEFGVRTVSRRNQQYFESGSKRIARHYKWSLRRALEVLEPHAPAVVVVEEDLLFSVDFYTYMLSSLGIIQSGGSSASGDVTDRPWTASGWNDNGYAGRVRDSAAVRLSHFFPGLGWILTRKTWDEVLATAWPDDHWDHWLREKSAMRSRAVIVPEVNRVFHAGVDGVFMNTHMHMKLFHYIAPYGGATGIDFDMSPVASITPISPALGPKDGRGDPRVFDAAAFPAVACHHVTWRGSPRHGRPCAPSGWE